MASQPTNVKKNAVSTRTPIPNQPVLPFFRNPTVQKKFFLREENFFWYSIDFEKHETGWLGIRILVEPPFFFTFVGYEAKKCRFVRPRSAPAPAKWGPAPLPGTYSSARPGYGGPPPVYV